MERIEPVRPATAKHPAVQDSGDPGQRRRPKRPPEPHDTVELHDDPTAEPEEEDGSLWD